MGKALVSGPQLGGAGMLSGASVAYCVRKIILGEPLESNRAVISLDEKLVPGYNEGTIVEKRREAALAFKESFKL